MKDAGQHFPFLHGYHRYELTMLKVLVPGTAQVLPWSNHNLTMAENTDIRPTTTAGVSGFHPSLLMLPHPQSICTRISTVSQVIFKNSQTTMGKNAHSPTFENTNIKHIHPYFMNQSINVNFSSPMAENTDISPTTTASVSGLAGNMPARKWFCKY